MTARERFASTLNFEKCEGRTPMVEWAAWWDVTVTRWQGEGLDCNLNYDQIQDSFGLDRLVCLSGEARGRNCPGAKSHGGEIITDEVSYNKLKHTLYTDENIERLICDAKRYKAEHDAGDIAIRLWLDGFFWFPRTLFGIENHFYAFYDYPELMKQINEDLLEYNIKVVHALLKVLKPEMVGFAEDMSYNHGPMLSYDTFKEFLLPYYQRLTPVIQEYGVKVLIDSDGDITEMIPWMEQAGIEGVYPLERQAGVDIVKIREDYPKFIMLGGYDKMVMPLGEEAMRAEFERLLPVMKSGGFIPSVDHQTPPGVSLENYKIYIKLFEEYCKKAISG